jgi:uncharacterized membrane protein
MAAMSRRGALREYLGGALWVLPSVSILASLLIGAGLAQIDVDTASGLGRLLFRGDADAARELLIIVSATMITVTGLVFTLTVVALQISSTQFTPRLLRSFLRDRGTQVVLAIFVSTFAYSTAGLYTVGRVENGEEYVPRVAISGSLLLAMCSVGAFVWYLHHLAHSIQIDDVMRRVERSTLEVLKRGGPPGELTDEPAPEPPADVLVVPAPASGYVQAAFPDAAVELAGARGLTIRFRCAVGDHVVAGSPIAFVWGGEQPISDDTAAAIIHSGLRIGFERTFEQDAAFGIRQLVDIGLRAMSPAVNDPYTAEQAIQHMTVVLCTAIAHPSGPEVWRDRTGRASVLLPMPTLADHLDLACGQLRRVAAHEPRVIIALLRMLDEVQQRVTTDSDRVAAHKEAALLLSDARRGIAQPADLAAVEAAAGRGLRTAPS